MMKTCVKCGEAKNESEFYLKGGKAGPDVRDSQCKACKKIVNYAAERKRYMSRDGYRTQDEIRKEAAEKRQAKIAAKPKPPTAWERLCKAKASELARKEDKWKKRANAAVTALKNRQPMRKRTTIAIAVKRPHSGPS